MIVQSLTLKGISMPEPEPCQPTINPPSPRWPRAIHACFPCGPLLVRDLNPCVGTAIARWIEGPHSLGLFTPHWWEGIKTGDGTSMVCALYPWLVSLLPRFIAATPPSSSVEACTLVAHLSSNYFYVGAA